MSLDRLAELQVQNGADGVNVNPDQSTPPHIELANALVRALEACSTNMCEAATEVLLATTDDEIRRYQRVARDTSDTARRTMYLLKTGLEAHALSTDQKKYLSAKVWKAHATYMARYTVYTESETARNRRIVRIVAGSELSDAQADAFISNGGAQQLLNSALQADLENLQRLVAEIEQRQHSILELERQVKDIFELFKDLSVLVDEQQESLNVIETRIQSSLQHVEKGEVQVEEADRYRRQARNRQCCLLVIVVCIVAVIVLPVIGTRGW